MKKYLLMASALLMAALFVSCEGNETDTPPPPPPPPGEGIAFNKIDDAVYNGEALGEGSGFYTFTLSNDSGDKMRVDCFGAVSTGTNNPRFTTGIYRVGSLEERAINSFLPAENATAEKGTIYWDSSNTAYPVSDGTMEVKASGSNYKLTIKFTSGDKKIEASYEGTMKFKVAEIIPNREENPNPRPADFTYNAYFGRMTGKAETGYFQLGLTYKGNVDTGANVEAIQIEGFIPRAEDNSKALLAEGTYTVVSSKEIEKGTAFTIAPGVVDTKNSTFAGSFELYTNDRGGITKGYMITEGKMEVVKTTGDNYKITVNFKGKRANAAGIVRDDAEDVAYEYEGPLPVMANMADPPSTLEEDLDLETFTNQALVQVKKLNNYTVWCYYLWADGIRGVVSNNILNMQGAGHTVLVAIAGTPQSTDLPVGEFPMSTLYMDTDVSNGTGSAWPGMYEGGAFNAANIGCWYGFVRSKADGSISIAEGHMGAVAERGFVKTSNNGDQHTVEFEFYDRYGHKLTGKYEGAVDVYKESGASSASGFNSSLYVPSFEIAKMGFPATFFDTAR